MVCWKRAPHKSPSSLPDAYHNIQAHSARTANTPAGQEALLRTNVPSETQIPTDWVSGRIKQGQKSQHQKDLEKAAQIVRASVDGKPYTTSELDWARSIGKAEQQIEEEKKRTITVVDSDEEREEIPEIDIEAWEDYHNSAPLLHNAAPPTVINLNRLGVRAGLSLNRHHMPLVTTGNASLLRLDTVPDTSAPEPEISPMKRRSDLQIWSLIDHGPRVEETFKNPEEEEGTELEASVSNESVKGVNSS